MRHAVFGHHCRWPKIVISSSPVFKNTGQPTSKKCTVMQNNRKQRKLQTLAKLMKSCWFLCHFLFLITMQRWTPSPWWQTLWLWPPDEEFTHRPTQLLSTNYTAFNSDSKLASLPWWLHWALMASTVPRSHCKWSKPLFLKQHFIVAAAKKKV